MGGRERLEHAVPQGGAREQALKGRAASETACYARLMGPFGVCRPVAALCFLAALPAADFTTYIGDANDYRVARVMADASGNTYIAGSRDAGIFVMRLDTAGKIVLFATLSGKGTDQP